CGFASLLLTGGTIRVPGLPPLPPTSKEFRDVSCSDVSGVVRGPPHGLRRPERGRPGPSPGPVEGRPRHLADLRRGGQLVPGGVCRRAGPAAPTGVPAAPGRAVRLLRAAAALCGAAAESLNPPGS